MIERGTKYQATVVGTLSTAGTTINIETHIGVVLRALVTSFTASAGQAVAQGSVDGINWTNLTDTDGITVGVIDIDSVVVGLEHTWLIAGYPFVRLITLGGFTGGTISLVLTAVTFISDITTGSATEHTLAALLLELQSGNIYNTLRPLQGYTTALDTDTSAPYDTHYIGLAIQGVSKAAANWQIRKLTYDVNHNVTDIQYANGSPAFANVWNNRVSLSYS